jgi:2-keto-4-pentenoate hydratase/2-oxohepta-3-ene-1,7-dioic acid hydratase in catechol pathway
MEENLKSIRFDGKEVVPSKIVCIGRNYVDHIKELDNEVPTSMVIFMKSNSSISEFLSTDVKDKIHYESEISFLILDGKIHGVGFGLDLTKREIQNKLKEKGLPWERAKSFDGASVFSEFVTFDGDINSLSLKLTINDSLIQQGGVPLMINTPREMIKEIESFSSLFDNDIVMSGTPKGVGVITRGDKFLGQILSDGKILVEKEWIVK